jgi:hypothetical protein
MTAVAGNQGREWFRSSLAVAGMATLRDSCKGTGYHLDSISSETSDFISIV